MWDRVAVYWWESLVFMICLMVDEVWVLIMRKMERLIYIKWSCKRLMIMVEIIGADYLVSVENYDVYWM